MSIILDLIIIIIAGVTVFLAWKNGFVKTAISAASFLIAIAVTAAFASPLASVLAETSIAESIEESTEEKISDMIGESTSGIKGLVDGESKEFNALISIAGIDNEELSEWYSEQIWSEDGESSLAKHIAEPIIDVMAMLVSVIILYIGTQILLSVGGFFLDKLTKLPVLRAANKSLGIALGAVLALFRVCLFCFAVNLLIEHSAFLGSDFINSLNADNTLLFGLFSKIDIFAFFI